MGFIDEKRVISAVFQKKSAQKYSWVEGIIVVADDDICPQGQFKGKFKGADTVSGGNFLNGLAGKCIPAEYILHGIVDPVKVTAGKLAFFWITGGTRIKADFIFGGNCQRL